MSDTVATEVLLDNEDIYMAKFTNQSDGTGEAAVEKITVGSLSPACYLVSIDEILWSCHGVGVDILWAGSDILAWTLGANTWGHIRFSDFAGALINTKDTSYTGSVDFTVTGGLASAGHGYSIILKCTKTK